MPLKSKLFTQPQDPKLEACLVSDPNHITPGTVGAHVKKIQIALNQLSSNVFLIIDGIYGPKTAAAVKAYKDAPQRRILGPGQTTADNIVGKKTIQSLDDEMDILENESDEASSFVSTTVLGAEHDHRRVCPLSGFARRGSEGRVHHVGTPINPQGTGRMINIGGEDETKYLGFQDFMTKTVSGLTFGPPRPFTEDLPSQSASDICMRSTLINAEIRKEISRLARPGCRLTWAGNRSSLDTFRPFLLSIGTVLEQVVIFDDTESDGIDLEVFVIRMRGDRRFLDFPPGGTVFPPPIDAP